MSDSSAPDIPEFDSPESDGQDRAEIWDEDNIDSDADRFASADEALDFDERPDVYDATRRVGDEDDDEALIGDDLDDESIISLSLDADEDDEEAQTDSYGLRGDDDETFDLDDDEADAMAHLGPDEVELEDAGDLNNRGGAAGSAKRFEAAHLSDEEIERLGYGPGEPRSFDPARERTHAENVRHDRLDALLDEAVEDTFPASDPVSAPHIS